MNNTIYDVAKLAGVSTATVSRVINRIGNVRPKTEEKVKRAMKQLNFSPNSLAQSFAKMKSKTLGFIISMPKHNAINDDLVESVYFTELFKGINQVTQKKGYSILFINVNEKNFEDVIAEFLDQKKIDGLIIGSKPVDTDFFRKVILDKKPIVYIGHVKEFNRGLHIYAQHSQYILSAIDYFEKEKHQHIALFSTKQDLELKALVKDKTNLKFDYYNVFESPENLHENIRTCFGKEDRPTALFYQGVAGIQPVISVLSEMNLSVPKDVSIISVEHRKGLGENFIPPITSVYVPVYEMGKTAANVLIEYIEGKLDNYDQQFNLESVIIERNSIMKKE